jgi:peroxiredoxin
MHAWLIAALVVSWVLVLALAGLLFVMVKQHGELILYQQDLDHRLEQGAYLSGRNVEGEMRDREAAEAQPSFSALPLGAEAPAFALADLEGRERTLEDYLGQPFVVGFFSTDCGYCRDLSQHLGKLPKKSHPLVLISHGDIEMQRKMVKDDKWSCDVVVDEEWDVAAQFMAAGTPSGYLIGADGKIASKQAMGSQALLELLEMEPQVPEPGEGDDSADGHENGSGNGSGPVATKVNTRDVSESKIKRDGLSAGTIAPAFALKDLRGKTRSLLDYRGKRVLLVFSDVTCGPCEQLAPELVRLYERRPDDLEIVMISRGDLEENKRKAKAFGYPFPVLVQNAWEVSKDYAMFATPIGYLVDADGIIVKDVAMGNEAILALADA